MDAGLDEAATIDAMEVNCPVLATGYDQTCTTNDDCLPVGQVVVCPPYLCAYCETGLINRRVQAEYMAAFNKAMEGFSTASFVNMCNCPPGVLPCCYQGRCSVAHDCY
jgi:hypothetical protein